MVVALGPNAILWETLGADVKIHHPVLFTPGPKQLDPTLFINNLPSVNTTSAPPDLLPIVSAIDDWNRTWRLGVIFECRVAGVACWSPQKHPVPNSSANRCWGDTYET